jgi:hypothetical protein
MARPDLDYQRSDHYLADNVILTMLSVFGHGVNKKARLVGPAFSQEVGRSGHPQGCLAGSLGRATLHVETVGLQDIGDSRCPEERQELARNLLIL